MGLIKLSQIASIYMGQSPPGNTYNLEKKGLPFFQGVTDFNYRFPTNRVYCTKPSRIAEKGDILLSVRAPIGRVNIAVEKCSTGRGLAIIRPFDVEDNGYIEYFLRSIETYWSMLDGSGVIFGNAKKSDLESLLISWPDKTIRNRIAFILSTYDDLIENNLRRIKILEEFAQTLYREWFINFRFPDYESYNFVDSPIGRVPEGFIADFNDFVDFKEGPGIRRWQYKTDGIPFLNIRTLVNNDIDLSKVNFLDPEEVKNKYQHFLLKEYDHVVSSSGTLGRVVTIQENHLPLMLNTSIIRMRSINESVGKWQLKHFLLSNYFQNQIKSFATGAAQLNYGPFHLNQMYIISPPNNLGTEYEELVDPIENYIISLVTKNNNLSKTRDLLLPKLISGELDVSNIDIPITQED